MTITLNGTTGITDVNGTAAAPAITGTDTDSGMYFGTNIVALATNGTNAVYVDASQNVGIGSTTIGSTGVSLAGAYNIGWVQTAGESIPNIFRQSSTAAPIIASGYKYSATANGFASSYSSSWAKTAISLGTTSGVISFYTDTAATVVAGTDVTPTERMRIDSSGNVGIGTTSTTPRFSVVSTSGTYSGGIRVNGVASGNANSGMYIVGCQSTLKYNWLIGSQFNLDNAFEITPSTAVNGTTFSTPAMAVDYSGNLLVGTTSGINSARVSFASNSAGFPVLSAQVGANGSAGLALYNSSGTNVGNVIVSASTTAYNTSSDYRLKNTIAPMTGALAKVALLKPCTYKWNADGSDGQGFIAHELQEVVEGCVTGAKDAIDADGNPVHQGVDTSFLVATLTAAIQEQQALITSLTDRIAALEAR
jgi:hypothetical protein